MCGIAGVIDYSGIPDVSSVVSRMTAAIEHRGPNGHGKVIQQNVGLGHRRLSIIDLEGGRQPMSTPDGQVHLTYNGEVYNFRELRRELEGKGFRFGTSSDTEVVLYAYEAWGKRCVEHFEGMFAFAIADFRKREVFLARDPFGIKPLLYRATSRAFTFASEIQALQASPDWTGEIDLTAIDAYLRLQYIPAPLTAFRKTYKLPAGHRMTVRMGEPFQMIERYWEPDFTSKRRVPDDKLVGELDEVLRDSVRRHLVSDVPFGALLSGGVDSSLVVGYMSELLDEPVKTFSIGFEDESINELSFARQVSKHYKTEHHEEIIRFDALDVLPEIVRHYGEPFGDQSAVPTWHVCRLARQHVPMVLSGDGGDELLGGYGTYGEWLRKIRSLQTANTAPTWRDRIRPVARLLMPNRYPKRSFPQDQVKHWSDCVDRYTFEELEKLWHPELRFLADQQQHQFESGFNAGLGLSGVNRVQRCDLETFLPEDILGKVDIASMRFGLEVRPPMLDRTFFQTAARIPEDQLYSADNDGRNYCGKLPLKRLAEKKLGHQFAFRPKQGFGIPLATWFATNTSEAAKVRERLTDPGAAISQWFDQSQVTANLENGRVVNIWLLLVLEEWLCQVRESQHIV